MTIVTCTHCSARYRLDDTTTAHATKWRCKKCHTIFRLRVHTHGIESVPVDDQELHAVSAAMSAAQQHTIGKVLHERYRIDRVLGQGSVGTTYKAFDLNTQRLVAIKQLHFSHLQDWKILEMFEREAKMLQHLAHPRIPAYIDYYTEESASDLQFVLIQEYIKGKTLQQLVEEGWRGPEAEILDVFLQLAAILTYLHTFQPPVIHRDINPHNIILSHVNNAYLVDFSAVQEKIRSTYLGGTTVVGTYGYVPFEQFSGQAVPASDYYALGATLLYMLTHRHPVDFPTDHLAIQFHSYLQASPRVVCLLEGLLEPSVDKRIASPQAIQQVLTGQWSQSLTTANESAPVEKPERKPPYGTRIKKIIEGENHIWFVLPEKTVREFVKDIPAFLILLAVIALMLSFGLEEVKKDLGMIGVIAVMVLVLMLAGCVVGVAFVGIKKLLTRIHIELTSNWMRVSRQCLGKRTSIALFSIGQLAAAAVLPASEGLQLQESNNSRTLIPLGTITQAEGEWLAVEITDYVATVKTR